MKKVYNKETYNEDGKFYRTEDWGVDVEDGFSKENFTTSTPIGLNQKVIPKQHYDNEWILDEAEDQGTLDAMTVVSKLKTRRAFRELGMEAGLDALIDANATFKADWDDSVEVDLSDAVLLQALNGSGIDVDKIKREIIKQENRNE